MTWRSTLFDRPRIDVSLDPGWLLAPLFTRDAAGLAVGAGLPGPLTDPPSGVAGCGSAGETCGSAGQTSGETSGARDAGGDLLSEAGRQWPIWWAAACRYEPGLPAPVQADLVAFSLPLSRLWRGLVPDFLAWTAARRPAADVGRAAEEQALERFAGQHGRDPSPTALRILVIPVAGTFASAPDRGRLVVSAELRANQVDYLNFLETALVQHF